MRHVGIPLLWFHMMFHCSLEATHSWSQSNILEPDCFINPESTPSSYLVSIHFLINVFFFSGHNSEEWRGVPGNRTSGKWRIMLFVLELMAANCFTVSLLDPALESGHFCIEQNSYAQNLFRMSHFLQWASTSICFPSHHLAGGEDRWRQKLNWKMLTTESANQLHSWSASGGWKRTEAAEWCNNLHSI